MNHSMTDVDEAEGCFQPIDSIVCEPREWASLPRAKPHERLTHGVPLENFFGICAEEFDDEFMESLREIRRGDNRTERCMTHSTSSDPIALIAYDEPLPTAKPEERLARGMRPEDFFGICADEIDDEFMEAVLAIRRGVWPRSSAHE